MAKIRIFRFARQQPTTANLSYTAVRDLVITYPTLSEDFVFLFSPSRLWKNKVDKPA